jgi:hypothetical protein
MTEHPSVVWKHELPEVVNDLTLVPGARVVHVAEQNSRLCLWEVHVVGQPPSEVRRFRVAGTGHEFPPNWQRHVGSLLAAGGAYVFHVFEESM